MERYGAFGILTLFLIFAILMVFIIPPGEAPDEPAHVDYVNFVANYGELPNQYHHDKRVPEGHQPPLYYLIGSVLNHLLNPDKVISMNLVLNPKQRFEKGRFQEDVPTYMHLVQPLHHEIAPLFKDGGDKLNFYLLRMLAVLFGAINVLFVLKTAQLLFKHHTWSLVPAFLVATLPTFIFMSAVVNNDCLANTLSTITIYYSLKTWLSPEKRSNFLLLGTSLGLALLAKKTTLVLLPPVATILIASVFAHRSTKNVKILDETIPGEARAEDRNGRDRESETEARVAATSPAIMSLYPAFIVIAISGWWFIRNDLLYGDLLGTKMEMATIMTRESSIFSRDLFGPFLANTYISFTGLFGWSNIELPHPVYIIHVIFFGTCWVGFLLRLWRERPADIASMFLLLYLVVAVAGFLYANNTFPHEHGRLLFPVISVIAIQVAMGAEYWWRFLKSNFLRRLLTRVIVIGLIFVDVLSVLVIHQFYYDVQQYMR